MNLQITTYSSYLLACLPHVDEFHHVPSLRYIHLCDGYMAASNECTAIMLEDKYLEGCNYLIPVNAVRELAHIFNENEENEYPEINIMIFEDGTGSLWTDGSFEINFQFGKFQTRDFRQLLDGHSTTYAGTPPILNPSLLALFQQSQRYLYGPMDLGVQVFPSGEESSAFISIDDGIYGFIMPLDPKFVREGKTLGYSYRGRDIPRLQNKLETL